jgi:heme exporter protein C
MKKNWWKALAIILVTYTLLAGLLMDAPRLNILNETIRNLHFHVTMWFGMVILLTVSIVYAIKYLRSGEISYDDKSIEMAKAGVLLGVLGIVTGAVWANYTWGEPWSGDSKQNAAAICLLIYFAYLVLRNSMKDEQQKARVSGVYNIFAYAAMIPLLFILPRLDPNSLHPGNGGNPGFNSYDLDSKLRVVFYPAVVGWTLMGVWLASLNIRTRRIERALED